MNYRNVKNRLILAVIAGFMGISSQVSALDQTSTAYVGLVNDGIPSSPADEVSYINNLITVALGTTATIGTETYTRSNNLCDGAACPTANLTGAQKDDTSPSTTVDVTGFEYLLGKYDADKAGTLVFYVGNLTGNQTIPGTLNGLGLSHWSLYNATTPPDGSGPPTGVPEPSTLLLLGAGLVAVVKFAKKHI
jgi:hypothetical protein